MTTLAYICTSSNPTYLGTWFGLFGHSCFNRLVPTSYTVFPASVVVSFISPLIFSLIQHEYDHLDGKVYIDRLSPEEKEKVSAIALAFDAFCDWFAVLFFCLCIVFFFVCCKGNWTWWLAI